MFRKTNNPSDNLSFRFIAGLLVVTLISLIVYGPLSNGLNISDMPWLPWTQEAQAEGDIWQPITITVTVIGVALLVAYYSAKLKSYKCDECNEKISSSESHITICDGCNKLYQNASCSSSTDEEIENHRQTTCTKCNKTYYMCGSIDGGPAGSLHTWHQEGNCVDNDSGSDDSSGNEDDSFHSTKPENI